jgi:hypothetical protein
VCVLSKIWTVTLKASSPCSAALFLPSLSFSAIASALTLPRTLSDWIRFKWEANTYTPEADAALAHVSATQDSNGFHDDLATSLHTLALVRISSLALDEAAQLLERAKALCELSQLPLTKTLVQAEIEISLATVQRDKGAYKAAEETITHVFTLLEARYVFAPNEMNLLAPALWPTPVHHTVFVYHLPMSNISPPLPSLLKQSVPGARL